MRLGFTRTAGTLLLGLTLLTPVRAAVLDGATINDHLGLLSNTRVVLPDLPADPAPFAVTIPLGTASATIDLTPHGVRAATFQIREEFHPGLYRTLPAPAARTLRGTVRQFPGAVVAGSLLDDGLVLQITLPDGRHFGLEPLGRFGDAADAYAVYDHSHVQPHAHDCLVLDPLGGGGGARHAAGTPNPCPAPGLHVAELAIDADYDYFMDYGDVDSVVAQVEAVVNAANLQYERDVAITHVITAVVVRSSPDDPYTSSSAETLLNQATDHWAAQQIQIQRDLVQVFTGRDLIGSTIGVAWLGQHSVCGFEAVSLVESNYNGVDGNFACKVDLTAHEMGHNWNAGHCNCSLYTMHPTIGTCTNTFHPDLSIPSISSYRDTRVCLDAVDTAPQLLRLRVEAAAPTVAEGATLQLTAIADLPTPPCTSDVDVTADIVWQFDPPAAGTIDETGLFVPAAVDATTDVTLTAAYDGTYGSDTATLELVVEDVPGDDTALTITLVSEQAPSTLVLGDTVAVDVRLASSSPLVDVRLLQFDVSATTGLELLEWQWHFDDLPFMPYGTFVDGPVHNAVFGAADAAPGQLAALGISPQRVASAIVRFNAPGTLDVVGSLAPATIDDGFAMITGFGDPQTFRYDLGNVAGGRLAFAITDGGPLQIVASEPPTGAIDARQPSTPDGSVTQGWFEVELTFSDVATGVTAADFVMESTAQPGPALISVAPLAAQEVGVVLSRPPVPGSWMTLIHTPSGSRIRLASLPADVNGDGTSTSLDLLSLIDHLNGIGATRPAWSTDINRSGVTEPLDILRAVDLLNGAGGFDVWNGVSLP